MWQQHCVGLFRFLRQGKNTGGGVVFVVMKEYGQKCELGTKINLCAIIYTGDISLTQLSLLECDILENYKLY